jgi:signal peptidase I
MAKRKRRSFPGEDRPTTTKSPEMVHSEDPSGGVFGFFKDYSVRETIESFIIAILLALVFRAFEAEAFIIPTGSMAPALQGQHKDIGCAECGHQYRTGVSADIPVGGTTCPICRFTTRMNASDPSHVTNNGDRILVNKFIYDFQEPERFDVIVFKNPNIAKENYIKRLIGLPGENILIENGDIYTMEELEDGSYEKTIARKPSSKLLHTLEIIADTKHRGKKLVSTKWPLQWKQRTGEANWESDGDIYYKEGPTFTASQRPEISWLKFRNDGPEDRDWPNILEKSKTGDVFKSAPHPGRLINDYETYNDFSVKSTGNIEQTTSLKIARNTPQPPGRFLAQQKGLHWVGDIGFEVELEIKSGTGGLFFDIVEGGAHFQMAVDTKSGTLELSAQTPENPVSDSVITFHDADGNPVEKPVAQTPITGPGSYQIRVINADDKIHLWVDGSLIDFAGCTYSRTDIPVPHFSEEDAGDAEPLGIGCQNLDVVINRIKAFRDLYYISTIDSRYMSNETGADPVKIIETMRNPTRWNSKESQQLFAAKKGQTMPMFPLLDSDDPAKDQFLPMGDNSAQSLDGRVWPGPRYFERDLLIGRAIVVFWPHTLSTPIPYMPNFGRMTFIK